MLKKMLVLELLIDKSKLKGMSPVQYREHSKLVA